MENEVYQYYREYLNIKSHFKNKSFWYGKNQVRVKKLNSFQYNYIKRKYVDKFTLIRFRKFLFIHLFMNENFSLYKVNDESYVKDYLHYHDNLKYNLKKDIAQIREKVTYDKLFEMYMEKRISFYSIIYIYIRYYDKLKFNDDKDKQRLNKYIYLKNKLKL